MTLTKISSESLKGMGSFGKGILIQGAVTPIVSLLLMYPLVTNFGVLGALISYSIGVAVSAVLGHSVVVAFDKLRGIVGSYISPAIVWNDCKPLIFITVINNAIMPQAGILAVGFWGSTQDIGIFGVCFKLTLLLGIVLQAVNSVVVPKYSALYTLGDLDNLKSMVQKTALLILAVLSPVVILVLIFPGMVLSMYGQEFLQGENVLRILMVGQFINVASGSVGNLLIVAGARKDYRNICIISALFLLAALAFLVPSLGSNGAALATVVGFTVLNCMSLIRCKQLLGFWALPYLVVRK
jgi:O-antigen/teichoic acid export membrane protein